MAASLVLIMDDHFLICYRDAKRPDITIVATDAQVETYGEDPAVIFTDDDGAEVFRAKARDLTAWGRARVIVADQ